MTKGDNRYSKEIGITLSNIYVLSVCTSHSVYTCKYATIVKDIVIVFKSKEGVQVAFHSLDFYWPLSFSDMP